MPAQTIEQVQEKYQDQWMALPGVVGVAIGENEGKLVLKVMVIKITTELEQKVPKNVEGYDVILEETGEFRALD